MRASVARIWFKIDAPMFLRDVDRRDREVIIILQVLNCGHRREDSRVAERTRLRVGREAEILYALDLYVKMSDGQRVTVDNLTDDGFDSREADAAGKKRCRAPCVCFSRSHNINSFILRFYLFLRPWE